MMIPRKRLKLEQEKSLADRTDNAERLDIGEGDATGQVDQGKPAFSDM